MRYEILKSKYTDCWNEKEAIPFPAQRKAKNIWWIRLMKGDKESALREYTLI